MPSFLNKVFGYKKHDEKDVARDSTTLLDGKYEAISPLSPSASTFVEAQSSDRDAGFSLFKPKSRQKPTPSVVPHLTLQLPGPKDKLDSRALGVVFEADPDSLAILDDAVIAAKRLNHLEALILIRACAQAIIERGLETLGIMHPHWFSASPDVQRKLISLFIRSLTPQNRITTLSPTSTSPTSAFENELHYTRSPHDVAAVLRWGLRHLSLENGHFGKETPEWAWYTTFFNAERNASYPPKAFSQLLLPHLPASHVELLTVTLNLISSLAAHAEINSISGSKLSKFLGIWLLVATRAEESDDWNRFYARWERAGRILEHLFLARLREESFGLRLPTRLQELVKHYPYNKGSPATEDELLSRPRFSTRQHDALCVRVETILTHDSGKPKQHPIQLLFDAFQLPIENASADEHIALWNSLKTTASEEATSSHLQGPQFARIFVDETIQLLSLISADNNGASPTLLTSPITKAVSRKRSSSFSKVLERALSKSTANDGSTPASPTSPTSPMITDWTQFSLSGFGGAPSTQPLVPLLNQDDDIEVTQPRISPKSSRQRGKSRTRRRRSSEREPSDAAPSSHSEPELSIVETKVSSVHVVQIDEAFIDFWSDAIADPISADWPTFVLCGLKETSSTDKPIRWLVIEQVYTRQQSPRNPSPDGRRGRSPRPSFRSDISGFRINSVFSSARKRFSVFSKSVTDLDARKSGGKTPITGELGEILAEEEPTFPSASPAKLDPRVDGNVAVEATVTSGATADVADELKVVNEISTTPIASIAPANQLSAVKEDSDSVHVTTKAPSVEPTPQSRDRCNGFPSSSDIEQGSPQALGSRVDDAADPLTNTIAVATDSANSPGDPMVIASGPTMQTPVAGGGRNQVGQDGVVEADVRSVPLPAHGDGHLPAEPSGEPSNVDTTSNFRQVVPTVAMSPAPESVPTEVAIPITQSATVAAVDDDPPEAAAEEPHAGKQPSRKASANIATSATESVDQHETDNLPPLSATEHKVIDTETQVQPDPNRVTSVIDGAEEVKGIPELAEIPTPAPEYVPLVEETPPGVYVDAYGRAGASQVPVAEPKAFQDTVPQPVTAELQATLGAEDVTLPVEVSLVEIIPRSDSSAPFVPAEAELAADQVSELAIEEAQSCEAAEALQVDVSAGIVAAAQGSLVIQDEVEPHAVENFVSEAHVLETRDMDAPTPAQENAALVDETPGPEMECEPVEGPPATTPDSEAVENKTAVAAMPESEALTSIPLAEEAHPGIEAELPTQALAEPLSSESNAEGATAALATVDEMTAVKVEAQPTLDSPSERPDTHTAAPECASVDDTLEIAVEDAPDGVTDPEPVEDVDGAQVPVGDDAAAVVSASAPIVDSPTVIVVSQDLQASIGFTEVSSASVSQSADLAAVSHGVDTASEELQVVVAEPAPLELEVGVQDQDAGEPELVSVPAVVEEPQVAVEAEEPSPDVDGVAEEADTSTAAPTADVDVLAEQLVTSEDDVSTQVPAEPSEECVPAEP